MYLHHQVVLPIIKFHCDPSGALDNFTFQAVLHYPKSSLLRTPVFCPRCQKVLHNCTDKMTARTIHLQENWTAVSGKHIFSPPSMTVWALRKTNTKILPFSVQHTSKEQSMFDSNSTSLVELTHIFCGTAQVWWQQSSSCDHVHTCTLLYKHSCSERLIREANPWVPVALACPSPPHPTLWSSWWWELYGRLWHALEQRDSVGSQHVGLGPA